MTHWASISFGFFKVFLTAIVFFILICPINKSNALTCSIFIRTAQELQNIKDNVSGFYCLATNIDASVTRTWNDGLGFEPIRSFAGTFDGRGYKIVDLFIKRPSDVNVGLFGELTPSAVVDRALLVAPSIEGDNNVGALAGINGGLISNSRTNGVVRSKHRAGGLIGDNGGVARLCHSGASVTGTYVSEAAGSSGVGGLVGINTGTVDRCSAAGPVEAFMLGVAGGLVGRNQGTVVQSFATGWVKALGSVPAIGGYGQAGGLVGWNSNGTIFQSYSSGLVNAQYAGGLVRLVDLGGSVRQSYSTGFVTGPNPGANGGLVASIGFGSGSVTDSYWDTTTSKMTTSAGGTGLTTTEFKSIIPSSFDQLVWNIDTTRRSYPFLRWHGWLKFPVQGHTAYGAPIVSVLDQSGTPIDPDISTRKSRYYAFKDGKVVAYTAEIGEKIHGENCPPAGYKNAGKTSFRVNGRYTGAACTGDPTDPRKFLNYDGHSGYDYGYPNLTPIRAAAAGKLFKATTDGINHSSKCAVNGWNEWHTFYINHNNRYSTYYLHASGLEPNIESEIGSDFTKSVDVAAGQVVAYVGNFGACTPVGYHLHFEVRRGLGEVVDPYLEGFWIDP